MMNVLRCALPLVAALLLASSGQTAFGSGLPQRGDDSQRTRSGNWAARAPGGRTLDGSWTAKMDPATGTAGGTWALIGPGRTVAARGAWSAAKSSRGWSGTWRAIVDGRPGELAGTWTADLELDANASLARLFETSLRAAGVSGTFRAGAQSGAWSIRAFE